MMMFFYLNWCVVWRFWAHDSVVISRLRQWNHRHVAFGLCVWSTSSALQQFHISHLFSFIISRRCAPFLWLPYAVDRWKKKHHYCPRWSHCKPPTELFFLQISFMTQSHYSCRMYLGTYNGWSGGEDDTTLNIEERKYFLCDILN